MSLNLVRVVHWLHQCNGLFVLKSSTGTTDIFRPTDIDRSLKVGEDILVDENDKDEVVKERKLG
jgi:hypothetical protein